MAEVQANTPLMEALGSFPELTIRVNGCCMQPVVPDGALARLISRKFYLPGDIVAYQNGIGQLVCHRFLGYRPARNGLRAVTQADSANSADAGAPSERVLGKVVAVDGDDIAVPLRTRVSAIRRWIRALSKR